MSNTTLSKTSNITNNDENETETDYDIELNIEESKNINVIEPIRGENKNEINSNSNINIDGYMIINIKEDQFNDKQKKMTKEINLSEYINNIYYFENIDMNYIINNKKYLMNNIFLYIS